MSQHKGLMDKISPKNVISFLVIILILFYLLRFLYENWIEVSTFDFQLKYHYLLISLPVLFGFFLLRVYCWRMILEKMDIFLSMRKSMKISFVSMMGRYLPGKVWLIMGKVYLSGKEGVPRVEAFASVVMEIVLEIVASIFFFFFFLFSFTEQSLLSHKVIYFLGVIMVVGLVFLHPKVFYRIINFILLRWKNEEIKTCMRYRDIIQLFAVYNLIVLFQGIAFYFFVNAICYVSLNNILGLTGSLAIAGALGTLSVFSPSGLGVREGILALLLTNYVISPMAVLISLLARIWTTLGEIICALFAWRL
ncbi:MAG: flippase-like domain-containing protein [Deltaproteobacteria bacterium]|nr:flippase-like domain-containing protein [Deltaproteobacteria bacterium]